MGTVPSHPAYSQSLPRPVGVSLPPPFENGAPKLHAVKPGTLSPSPNSGFRTVVITPKKGLNNKKEVVECTPEDDGYRWRKYGRKSVKGNQFPRSYYKCTQVGCQVKKQVETIMVNSKPQIHTTYKGEHNHEPPQVTRLNVQDQLSFKNSVISEFLGQAEGGRQLSRSLDSHLMMNANQSDWDRIAQIGSPRLAHLAAIVAADPDSYGSLNSSANSSEDSDDNSYVAEKLPSINGVGGMTNLLSSGYNRGNVTLNSPGESRKRKYGAMLSASLGSLPDGVIGEEKRQNVFEENRTGVAKSDEKQENNQQGDDNHPASNNDKNNTNHSSQKTSEEEDIAVETLMATSGHYHSTNSLNSSNGPSSGTNSLNNSIGNGNPLNNSTGKASSETNLLNTSNGVVTSERYSKPGSVPRLVVETNASVDFLDDGYHWRKYGQKNVKGSRYPRSYYKCTEKDCPVKKQVEQSGSTMINTYEGTHNHKAPGLEENQRKRRKRRRSNSNEMQMD